MAKPNSTRRGPGAPVAKASGSAAGRRIEHVVVLMLENRSFDHIFGFRPGVAGLKGTESNLLDAAKPRSSANPAFKVAQNAPFAFASPSQGPGHSFTDANTQLTGASAGPSSNVPSLNNGYVQQFNSEMHSDHIDKPTTAQLEQVMQSFSPSQLPSINALAGAFTVCDHWFSEVPGPTQPNRLFMHAATSQGMTYNNWSQKFDCRTIYNNLQDAGLTWTVYWTDDNEVAEFTQVASEADNFKDYQTSFVADAKAGKLPNYTFIEPQFNNRQDRPANSQHPPNDARYGDQFIAEVYEAVRANEEAWERTLLIVTYDEHGGLYDHVVPPATGVPNPDGINAPPPGAPGWVGPFSFDRLGMRVPAVLASPWIDPGVESRQLQHTSVLATVKNLFGLPSFLTKRDQSAAAFDDLLSRRTAPRSDTPVTLPRAVIPTANQPAAAAPNNPANGRLDATQSEVAQGALALTATAGQPSEPLATTQHEASLQMHRRINAYLQHQKKAKAQAGQFQIAAATGGGFGWTLLGPDGKPLAKSARTYATRPAARAAVQALATTAMGAAIAKPATTSRSKKVATRVVKTARKKPRHRPS